MEQLFHSIESIKAFENLLHSLFKKTPFAHNRKNKRTKEYAGIPVEKLKRLAKQHEHRWLKLPNGTFLRYVSKEEVLVRHQDGSVFQLHYEHPSHITSRLVNPTAEQLMLAAENQAMGTKMSISPESVLTSKRSS